MSKPSPEKKKVPAKAAPTKKTAPKKKDGRARPDTFTQERADEILHRLSNGEPMAVICRSEGMPSVTTVWNWSNARPEFAQSIARARESGFDVLAAECLQIANTPIEGVETTIDEKGMSEKRGDMLGHRKLQIDTRLKLLAKWDPKRYGDKLDVTQEVKLTGSVSYRANMPRRVG